MSITEKMNRSAVLPHPKAYPIVITSSPVPVTTRNKILIRVRAVAINPIHLALGLLEGLEVLDLY